MAQHAWTSNCLPDFVSRGVRFGVSSSLHLDAIFDVLLVVVVQPLGTSRVVRQKEDDR